MKRVALFVGIDRYNDGGINDLACAVNDAKAVCKKLQNKGYETHILLNESAGKITVLNKVEELCKDLQDNDVFLFYFAGHGHETGGNHYLLCHNAKTATLDIDGGADAIPLAAVTAISEGRNLRRLFILDSCRNNILSSTRSTYKASRDISFSTGKNYDDDYFPPVLLRSCCGGQCAFEDQESGHGFFTLALLDALESANSFSNFIENLKQGLSKKVKGKKQKISLSDGTNGFPLLDGWKEETNPEEKTIVTEKNTVWQKFIAILAVIAIVISGVAIYKSSVAEPVIIEPPVVKKPEPVQPLVVKKPEPVQPLVVKKPEPVQPPVVKKPEPTIDFSSEAYSLEVQIKSLLEIIPFDNLDRGQMFGNYVDKLKKSFNAGKQASNNGEYKKAFDFFKEAQSALNWINTNKELRESVRQKFKVSGKLIEECKAFNAPRFAGRKYSTASQKYAQAEKFYNAGQFPEAITALKEAVSEYESALSDAKNETMTILENSVKHARKYNKWNKLKEIAEQIRPLDNAKADVLIAEANRELKAEALEAKLKLARQAKANKDWQRTFDIAKEALVIDSTSQEAQGLKTEAEQQLVPSFNLYFKVNGKIVTGTYIAKKKQPIGDAWPKQLEKNGEYLFECFYKPDNGDVYFGELSFTCNWNGPRTFEVELKKQDFSRIELPNGVFLEMVKIPRGSFKKRDNNTVTLTKDYWIGKFEVTQAQWKAVIGRDIYSQKARRELALRLEVKLNVTGVGDKHPVYFVRWEEAKDFCKRLNERYAGKLPAGYQFDLPTEAQWEYACRAGTETDLNHGKNLTTNWGNCPNLNEVAWYGENSGGRTHEVGQKCPNAWGLYDMHGNVFEWCRDWFNGKDPTDPSAGRYRVIRGGSWDSKNSLECFLSKFRGLQDPRDASQNIGFRLALVPIQ